MRRFVALTVCLWAALAVVAQTQQGFVKTKGRMVNGQHVAGQGLPGATVTILGRSAVAVKNANGSFSFPVSGKSFRVQGVQKKGYQLVDADATAKAYQLSSNPVYFVMETPEQQMQDQLDAERKLRRTLQQKLQQREDEIDAMQVTMEEKQRLLQQLYKEQENNDKLIAEMAKKYALMDYDQMDLLNQRISDAIINGRLIEADSLLRSKGDLSSRIADIRREQQAEATEQKELTNRLKNLEVSRAGTQKKLEDIAQDCYNYYNRFKLENQHDSAAYYIRLRAELDTTKVAWQKDAANYFYNDEGIIYIALKYALRAWHTATEQGMDNEMEMAEIHMLLGDIYLSLKKQIEAQDHYSQGATIVYRKYGENHPYVAEFYYHSLVKIKTNEVGPLLSLYMKQKNIKTQSEQTIDSKQDITTQPEQMIDGQRFDVYKCISIWENALEHPIEGFDTISILCRLGDAYENIIHNSLMAQSYYFRAIFAYGQRDGIESMGVGRVYYRMSEADYSYLSRQLNYGWSDKNRITWNSICYTAQDLYSCLAKSIFAFSTSASPNHHETVLALDLLKKVTTSLKSTTPDIAKKADSLFKNAHPLLGILHQKVERAEAKHLAKRLDPLWSAEDDLVLTWKNNRLLYKVQWANIWKIYALREDLMKNIDNDCAAAYSASQRYSEQSQKAYIQEPELWCDEYAEALVNQSYFAIFLKQYAEAEQLAIKGLEVESTRHIIATNLAAAQLFQGKYNEAEKIYRQYKTELKDNFLDDFKQFAEAGVIPKEREADVEKIKQLLNE